MDFKNFKFLIILIFMILKIMDFENVEFWKIGFSNFWIFCLRLYFDFTIIFSPFFKIFLHFQI